MVSKPVMVLASVVLLIGLLLSLVACAQPAPATPTTTTPTTTPAEPKTVKIAMNMASNWPLGLDCIHMVEYDVDKVNNNGGLDIGGEKYLIEFVFNDTKMDMALVKTLGEKAIFQDKVSFILGDPWSAPLFEICETNKVIGMFSAYDLEIYGPDHEWTWGCGTGTATYPSTILYAADKILPEKKTFLGVYPDRYDGHLTAEMERHFAEVAGFTVLDDIFYPATTTDLSAIATKIKQLDPDILVPMGGGPPLDAGCMKAAHAAGWKGQLIGPATVPGSTIIGIAGPEAVEGIIAIGWPAEFDPATTPEAQEWKDAYIARFGKWDNPESVMASTWFEVKAALQQAGSVDKEKVKAALDNGTGHPFESPQGTNERFPRLDQGNPRTVDCVIGNIPVKTIEGGQVKLIDTIPLEQQLEAMKRAYGAPW